MLRSSILLAAAALSFIAPGESSAQNRVPEPKQDFVTVHTEPVSGEAPGNGRLSVVFLHGLNNDVTEAVRRQGSVNWWVSTDGDKFRSAATVLKSGTYEFVLDFGGRYMHRSLRIEAGKRTVVTIQSGRIDVRAGTFQRPRDRVVLFLTYAPDLTAEQFARYGCRPVKVNLALAPVFRSDALPATFYLPPGLYRLITEYDRQTAGRRFVRVAASQSLPVTLDETGAHPQLAAPAPVFHDKCYY